MLECRIWYIKSLIEFDLVMSTPLTPRVYKEVLEEELLNQLHLVFFIWRLGSRQASTILFLAHLTCQETVYSLIRFACFSVE